MIDYKKVLKRFMEDLLKGTSYQLMERGENSKKSNFTPYIRYEKNGEKYKFIVAEHIEAKDICDKNKYRVYYTSESNKLILEIER